MWPPPSLSNGLLSLRMETPWSFSVHLVLKPTSLFGDSALKKKKLKKTKLLLLQVQCFRAELEHTDTFLRVSSLVKQ